MPPALKETSGIAVSRRSPEVLWTHSDEGPELFALDRSGTVIGRFSLDRGVRDPEDLAAGTCRGEPCLYLADTGDNAERRPGGDPRILRVSEPRDPTSGGNLETEVFPIRLPDGPRDIEAIFVLPGERVYLITKGRSHAVTVYRYPGGLRDEVVTLEPVQALTEGPQPVLDQVTGASAAVDGQVVAVRSYRAVRFYLVEGEHLVPRDGGLVNLRPLEEIQGEGVALGFSGAVWLTSEGGPLGGPAALNALKCAI